MRFTERILSTGSMSEHLIALADHQGRGGHISKKQFIHQISMARGQQDSATDRLYFPIEDAREIAEALYDGVTELGPDKTPTLSFHDMARSISKINLAAGVSHGSKN